MAAKVPPREVCCSYLLTALSWSVLRASWWLYAALFVGGGGHVAIGSGRAGEAAGEPLHSGASLASATGTALLSSASFCKSRARSRVVAEAIPLSLALWSAVPPSSGALP